ncbi:MAG TPA: hypothetical protein VGH74_22720, partial [Planctomycetaceae bacterium]
SINAAGTGISLVDTSGNGPLSVDAGAPGTTLGVALGLAGTEPGNNNAVPLVGTALNQQEAGGILNILVRLQNALQTGDNATLTRLGGQIATEADRLSGVRGVVGSRLQTLQNIDNSLQSQNLQTQQALSNAKDTDMATVLSELVAQQTAFEATLRIAAQTMQLSLANYL